MTNFKTATVVGSLVLGTFALSACVPPETATKTEKKLEVSWKTTRILNQGSSRACTGFTLAGMVGKTNKDGFRIYKLATKLDHARGTYPVDDIGSTLPAAAKAAKQLHYIKSYKVIRTASGALKALKHGRVAVTLNNYPDFGTAHAMILTGKNGKLLYFQSSWGTRVTPKGIVHVQLDEFMSNFEVALTITK